MCSAIRLGGQWADVAKACRNVYRNPSPEKRFLVVFEEVVLAMVRHYRDPLNPAWGEQAEGGWAVGQGREAGWRDAAREKPCCTWRPLRWCFVVFVGDCWSEMRGCC